MATHECSTERMVLATTTYDRKRFPFRETKVPHCFDCGAIFDGGKWFDKRDAFDCDSPSKDQLALPGMERAQ